jgi:hypothetical protein
MVYGLGGGWSGVVLVAVSADERHMAKKSFID